MAIWIFSLLILSPSLFPEIPDQKLALSCDHLLEEGECDPCCLPSRQEEEELFNKISLESRRLYHSLDCKGKVRAIQLAAIIPDKNRAVQEAALEMAKRQEDEYPYQDEYDQQLEERNKTTPYQRRYGY